MAAAKCLMCGGTNLEMGMLLPTGFLPKHAGTLTKFGGGVPVQGEACVDCGHLQLAVDAAKLAKLIGRAPSDPRRGFPVTSPPTPRRSGTR